MEPVASFADRWGEIGIIMFGLAVAVIVLWRKLSKHQDDCDEKERRVTANFASGDTRMDAIEGSLKRGTEKMDVITAGQRSNGETIARLDERTRGLTDAIVRIEKGQDRLIGFHERKWADRGDDG